MKKEIIESIDLENLHPTPLMRRNTWESLNGEWFFCFDDEKIGIRDRYYEKDSFLMKIHVPFTYESKMSGIGDTSHHEAVWYCRTFEYTGSGIVLLRFAGVDYAATIWINGQCVGSHRGGYTSFGFNITAYLNVGKNRITVFVQDNKNPDQLRGKQRCKDDSYLCWYIQNTGIWKEVWLEFSEGPNYITNIWCKPDGNGRVKISTGLSFADKSTRIRFVVFRDGIEVSAWILHGADIHIEHEIEIPDAEFWSPEKPILYDLRCILENIDGSVLDIVETYFGFRTISTCKDGIRINGKKYYHRMVLDQGYWEDSMMTPPSAAALLEDIILAHEMGFNGMRKHQKVEDDRYYYLCDRLGMLVWAEIPSAYRFNEFMKYEFQHDMSKIIFQLAGHPCISAWVVFNESWGIPEVARDKTCQDYVAALSDLVRALDCGRPVISNDGWHHVNSDIISLHEYEQDAEILFEKYCDSEVVLTQGKINNFGPALVGGRSYCNEPVIISEFGGISTEGEAGWGYGDKAVNEEEYLKRFSDLFRTLFALNYVSGVCYTQLTDVQQETNGLLSSSRQPKVDLHLVRRIVKGEAS